jgi:hypothetical protein
MPVPAKAGPMPPHQGLGPNNHDGLGDRWKPSKQLDQEQAIPVPELHAATHFTPQHNQLMPERRVLCFKSALRLKGETNRVRKKESSPIISRRR